MTKRTMRSKSKGDTIDAKDPIGIVISNGSRTEDAPRFAAYVWGPVPEAELDEALVAVA